jgi:G1/S-specific cyclin PLC1
MVLLPDAPESALCQFIFQPVSQKIISHLDDRARQVAEPISDPPLYLAPRPSQVPVPSVLHFVASVVESSHVQVGTLMASLVYLRRLQSVLSPTAPGSLCSAHRIFLVCLIIATKYVNDICPKNKHWVRYNVVPFYETLGFTISEINAMEREFLCLLEWDLRIDLDDLCYEMRPLLSSKDQREPKLNSGPTFLTQIPRTPVLAIDRHQLIGRIP